MESRASPRNILLIDSTLRDGEQAPGVSFSDREKLEIAVLLTEAGIDAIEVGLYGGDPGSARTVAMLLERDCPVLGFCRARDEDLRLARDYGLPRVHISFPISDRLLALYSLDTDWLYTRMGVYGAEFAGRGVSLSAGFLDASRAGEERVQACARAAAEAGFTRIRYADTVGILDPWETEQAIEELRATGAAVEFHGHNDLGLATANSLAALRSGAAAVSATLLGLGERAGNCALEELVVAGLRRDEYRFNFDPKQIWELCETTARFSGRPIPADKPVAGGMVFSHESGIHTAGIVKDSLCFEAFSPAEIGRTPGGAIFGATSGRRGVAAALKDAGLAISDDELQCFLDYIKESARRSKCSYNSAELETLYVEYASR